MDYYTSIVNCAPEHRSVHFRQSGSGKHSCRVTAAGKWVLAMVRRLMGFLLSIQSTCNQSDHVSKVPRTDPPPQRPLPPFRQPSNAKASFQSPTPSFEADDEGTDSESTGTGTGTSMEPEDEQAARGGRPQYPGEDTRLTSNKELSGWYSYGWAAEVFVVCGVGEPNRGRFRPST